MKYIVHIYLRKFFSFIIDLLFLSGFWVYKLFKSFYLARWKNPALSTNYNVETCIDVIPENNIPACDDPIRNLELDWEYVQVDFRHKKVSHYRKIVETINKKNDIKKIIVTKLSIMAHVLFLYFIILFFFSLNSTKHQNQLLNNTIESDSDIYWYHAKLAVRKHPTYHDLMQSYGDVINKKCTPLKEIDILQNRISEAHGTPDLTFLYHSMCHLAIDQTLHSNPARPSIITPKFINITDFRMENNDLPSQLFNANYTIIPQMDIPNLCIMAIALPAHDEQSPLHDHNIPFFAFENALHQDLPPGIFIHSSKLHKTNNSASFDVNPIMKSNTSEIWTPTPLPGHCAILINPYIIPIATDNSHYSIIHSSALIAEEILFETPIKNFTLSYYDIKNIHRTIEPPSEYLKMQIQTIWNIMAAAMPFTPVSG